MNSQEFRALQEAYSQVYAPQEFDEVFDNLIDAGARVIKKPVQDYANKKIGGLSGTLGIPGAVAGQRVDQTASDLKKGNYGKALNTVVSGVKTLTQSYDLYDIILSHLIDEGYADTEQAAEAIMVNMSEDWRESIVESIARGSAPNDPTGNLGGIVSNLIKTGVDTLKKNVPSGGYSTRPGDGKPYKDGPLWDGGGPKTSPKPPIKPPKGPANRDEPLW